MRTHTIGEYHESPPYRGDPPSAAATGRAVHSYTYPVTFDNRRLRLGTAVLLRRGERLFAFTAAHNIAADTSIHLRLSLSAERTQFHIMDTYVHL